MNLHTTTHTTSRAKPMHQSNTILIKGILSKTIHRLFELVGVLSVIVTICLLSLVASIHFFEFPMAGKLVVVRSGSMEPTVPLGSLVWLHPLDTYTVGQVIAYNHPDSNNAHTVVLHRIQTKTENMATTYQTKGDANSSVDAVTIHESNILGAMKYRIHFVGYVVTWLQSQVGVLVTIIFPAILLVTHYIRSLVSARRQ
jgi:signal peptidase I